MSDMAAKKFAIMEHCEILGNILPSKTFCKGERSFVLKSGQSLFNQALLIPGVLYTII